MKTCTNCKCDKLLTDFHKNKSTPDGHARWCKSCKSEFRKKRYNSSFGDLEREKNRNRMRVKRYGLSVEEFDRMAKEQNQKCYICKKKTKVLHVDHCHKTGNIRKLLCRSCNLMLGFGLDDPETLRKGVDYLERFS